MLALVAALLLAGPASAATYGDLDVTVESEPKGQATHGYAEVWVRVANNSGSAPHAVRLTYPRVSYPTGVDHLRAVTRTVTVEPGKVVRVALAFPERLAANGTDLGVAIDGREQEVGLPFGYGSRGYGSSPHGGYGSRSPAPPALVLYSLTVDTRFPDWFLRAQSLPVPGGTTRLRVLAECVRAERPAEAWSPLWIGYSRYDGVVVTADDLRKMSAEVKSAVAQYVEAGGSLLILGGRPADLPSPWKSSAGATDDLASYSPGFGHCLLTHHTEFLPDGNPTPPLFRKQVPMHAAMESWATTLTPWQRKHTPGDANRRFPVVDDLGTPTTGLLFLMIAFVVVIGPLNLYLLARYKRKLWLFVTVPAVSLGTCLLVFGTLAVAEGWQGRSRVEGFTVIDETSRRASTLGWCGFYTTVPPRDGLRFGPDTELTFQNGDDYRGGYNPQRSSAALAIDWTHEQTLTGGWVAPRVPAHFAFRKSEQRRERVTFNRSGDRVEAVNGLGADLTDLWYMDAGGNVFRGQNVAAGARAALTPVYAAAPPRVAGRTLRDIYAGDWADLADWAARDGPAMLTPRTYLGVMAGAPFLDDPLPGATRRTRSAVLGICKEGGDGG